MIVGHAHILASVLLWHTNDLQGLVEVLKLDLLPRQLPTFLKPLDDGCWTGGESNGRNDKTSTFRFMGHYSLFKQVLILSLRSTCVTHRPAAIHSSSSCSSRSTILELSLPDGERKVGVDSATLRSADVTRGRINAHKENIHLSLQHDSLSPLHSLCFWINQDCYCASWQALCSHWGTTLSGLFWNKQNNLIKKKNNDVCLS